jgi:thiol:disulfide interchange protein DsbC
VDHLLLDDTRDRRRRYFMRVSITTVAVLDLVLSTFAMAEGDLEARLAAQVTAALPGLEVTEVHEAPVKGLYEVSLGSDVLYVSEDGRYAFKGDLFDLNGRRNLSEERRGQIRLKAFGSLKPESLIEFAPRTTKHVLYVFTDVDCGYCRKFHTEVRALNDAGIAVRYLAFPRAGVGSETYGKMESVWCAKDRQAALTSAKNGERIQRASCNNPVKQQYELGQQLGVRGTPTIITDDGRELGGYVSAAELVRIVAGGAT